MLRAEGVEVVYGGRVVGLHSVTLELPPAGAVALLGANGAGKTTLLRALSGLLTFHDAEVRKGQVSLEGESLLDVAPEQVVGRGVVVVLEGRRVFEPLTVEENLRAAMLGGQGRAGRSGSMDTDRLDWVYGLLPPLRHLRGRRAGFLSGGEQQMLAIGRAMMTRPSYLLLDEPTLGLAPTVAGPLMEFVAGLREQGTALLVVEQNAGTALDVADHGYILESGRVVMYKPSDALRRDPDVMEFYLGVGEGGQEGSLREVKRYRRRKRWYS